MLLAHLSSDQGEPDKAENYTVWLDCTRLSFPWEVIYFSNSWWIRNFLLQHAAFPAWAWFLIAWNERSHKKTHRIGVTYIFFMVQRQICITRQTCRDHESHKKWKLSLLVCRFNCKSYWHIFHFLSARKIQFWFWEILLCRIWGFLIFRWLQDLLHGKFENEARIWFRKRWTIAALSYFQSLWIHRKTNQAHLSKKNKKSFSQLFGFPVRSVFACKA